MERKIRSGYRPTTALAQTVSFADDMMHVALTDEQPDAAEEYLGLVADIGNDEEDAAIGKKGIGRGRVAVEQAAGLISGHGPC